MDLIRHRPIDLSPAYLLALSKQVDLLSKLAIHDRLGSLTQQFSQILQTEFTQLAHYLALYSDDLVMRDCALVNCKLALAMFLWEKGMAVFPKELAQLKSIFGYLLDQIHNLAHSLEVLIHHERRAKAETIDGQKDKIIAGLRRELLVKRQYVQDLEERVREIEDQNSKLYSKLITNAKQKVDYFSKSTTTQQYRSGSSDKSSPRKKVPSRSFQDEITEILESKRKNQGISERRTSLSDYLRVYFAVKYGKPLAEQNEANFRESVCYLARSQQKHIFVLFQAILDEQCDQAYYLQERLFHQKLHKYLKRYISQKYNRPAHELDRLFDHRNDDKIDIALTESDIKEILTNIYRFGEVHTLQMILSQLVSSRSQEGRVSCRRFINELLEYELKKHMMRVEDIVREIQRLPDKNHSVTHEQLQRVVLRTISDPIRCEGLMRGLQRERPWTVSEVIEIVEKARRARVKRE